MNKKKRYKSIGRGDTIESVLLGGEPNIVAMDIKDADELIWQIQKALNWYNYNWSEKEYRKYTLEYLKKTKYSKADQEAANNAPTHNFDFRCIGAYCRIANNGVTLPDFKLVMIGKHIANIIQAGYTNPVQTVNTTEKPKSSIQDRIHDQVSDYIAELENKIDDFLESQNSKSDKFVFDVAAWTKQKEIKSVQSQMIADSFKSRIEELSEALAGKDPDLKQAYSWLSKPKLKKFLEFHQDIVSNFQAQAEFAKTMRKPRKKKKKKPEQIVAKLKYQKEYPQCNISSVDPRDIIGAKKLVTFNTKYRTLTVYESSQLVDGFTFKGTTLLGFDENLSNSKKLRDPFGVLPKMIGGVRAINNAWESVKTKQTKPNGRINSNTVLVQVIK
jgi:hypothetical protein